MSCAKGQKRIHCTQYKLKTGFVGGITHKHRSNAREALMSPHRPQRCVGLSIGGQTCHGKTPGEGLCAFGALRAQDKAAWHRLDGSEGAS